MNEQDPEVIERELVGVYTDVTGQWPEAHYVYRDSMDAPTLTHDLVDEVCGLVDTAGIWDEAQRWTAVGEDLRLAERTLDVIRAELHARVHGISQSSQQSSDQDGETSP